MRRPILAGLVLASLVSASLVSASLVLAVLASAVAPASAQSLRDMQERYCMGDAFRLCSSEIPDESRIVACMARLRHMLSPNCRVVFDQSEPAAQTTQAARKTRRPTTLVPD